MTGTTKKSAHVLELINKVIDAKPTDGAVGITAILHKGRIVMMGDTLVHEWPDEEDLADIATRGAHVARGSGWSLGWRSCRSRPSAIRSPSGQRRCIRRRLFWIGAVSILNMRRDDGGCCAQRRSDGALPVLPPDRACECAGGACAAFGVDLRQVDAGDGGGDGHRPILTGIAHPVQICSTVSTVNDILNMAAIAACRLGQDK